LFKQKIENQTDHPMINSRYLMFEAQQAHYYGLNPALALASVTSTPAKAAGLDHRVGTIAEGLLLSLSFFIKASYLRRYRI
jgi:imidazolonepropionase-like amidohydrolase